jgi:hypothetical protein
MPASTRSDKIAAIRPMQGLAQPLQNETRQRSSAPRKPSSSRAGRRAKLVQSDRRMQVEIPADGQAQLGPVARHLSQGPAMCASVNELTQYALLLGSSCQVPSPKPPPSRTAPRSSATAAERDPPACQPNRPGSEEGRPRQPPPQLQRGPTQLQGGCKVPIPCKRTHP